MPTITVLKNDLYRLADLEPSLPLAALEEKLALVKGELGSRSRDGRELRAADGTWLDSDEDLELRIELADTNRPDLWCTEGIARQLRDHARGRGQAYDFFSRDMAERHIEVDPRLGTIRPFAGGFLAHGSTIDEDSLLAFIEVQETLTRNFGRRRQSVSIGLYNSADMSFPVHYQAVDRDGVCFEPLAPAGESPEPWPAGIVMTPEEILNRHPTGQEYAWVLEDYDLVPLLTDASGAVLSFPPIINSAHLGRVAPGMSSLFVEATGTDLDQCLLALNILATNLADRGWTITPVTTRYPYSTPRGLTVTSPHEMSLSQRVSLETFNCLLGEHVEAIDVATKLQAYGVTAEVEEDEIIATISSYRQDYLHAVDVVEDYAISRGYAAIAPIMPEDFTVGKLHPMTAFEDLVRDLMIGFGFEEAICNILTSDENLRQRMELGEAAGKGVPPFHGGCSVRIENVMNRNYSHLRDWVLPSLLEVESHSAGALYPHRIFEVGEVAVYDLTQNLGSRTESRLAAIIAEENASFDLAQSIIYALLGSLDISFKVVAWDHPSFIDGRVALLTSRQDVELGFLGELSPQVLTNWGARVPIAAFEISLEALRAAK
ncbi:MAG TPA: phenylalanine--tRNA ligase subunit beta, partial [Anaerolineae bacterium]